MSPLSTLTSDAALQCRLVLWRQLCDGDVPQGCMLRLHLIKQLTGGWQWGVSCLWLTAAVAMGGGAEVPVVVLKKRGGCAVCLRGGVGLPSSQDLTLQQAQQLSAAAESCRV